MKKYTHAWLAFMAMKRLEYADIPEKYQADAKALIKWFKDYRDCVIDGSWYPDEVFKDMATSHVLKYSPVMASDNTVGDASTPTDVTVSASPSTPTDATVSASPSNPTDVTVSASASASASAANSKASSGTSSDTVGSTTFGYLPDTIRMFATGQKSPLYKKPYVITSGNLPDRCEALSHSIVDCFKMLRTEDRGCPISPTGNHIAMRFFILSHYVVDAHMPLHCDSRPFSDGANIHGYIEGLWETQVKKSYSLDTDNERFYYDPQGYPLHNKITPLMEAVEAELVSRPFTYEWGKNNDNTGDYIRAISQFSYLNAYRLIPAEYDGTMTRAQFQATDFGQNFDTYSLDILSDTIESVARIWLHVWIKYRKWAKLSPIKG